MGFRLEDFSMDQRKCTAPWKYIWVNSGFSTCALRKETVTGAQGLYAPPFAAPEPQRPPMRPHRREEYDPDEV